MKLEEGYEIRSMEWADFEILWKEFRGLFFDDRSLIFRARTWLSPEEKNKLEALASWQGEPHSICLGLYYAEKFVGWSYGFQDSAEGFYMCNSAVFPEHRKKGLYTALMSRVVELAVGKGFQKIHSCHTATNNEILIPKLKAGFLITSFELSDLFGVLIRLTYFPNSLRRKVMDFRSGQIRPDADIKKIFEF